MITLSLDLSTKSSGYSIFQDQNLIDYGCITSGSSNLFTRIDKMIEGLTLIINKYTIDAVVIEDVYPEDVKYNQNVFSALKYLQGFVLNLLDKNKITNIKFFTASEWRKKCGIHTGRGVHRESLKPQDIKFVQNQFGIKTNDDVADAICIGFAAVGGEIKNSEIEVTDDGFEFI